jgi:hypothetical protein
VERLLGESDQTQEFKASRDRVYQMVLDNLNETNRFTQQKNEIDATLIAARTAVRAAQLHMTPEDLFKKHLLKVTADEVTGNQVFHQAQKVESEITQWSEGKLKSSHIIDIGNPSATLQQFGVPNLPIQLRQKILKKAGEKHGITAEELKGIGLAIHNPIAVFASKKGDGHLAILTELPHQDGNITAMLELNKQRNGVEITDITSLHPKNAEKISHWIRDGLLLRLRKRQRPPVA